MTRVVYNADYGGFSLSNEACSLLKIPSMRRGRDISRTSLSLIELIDDLGSVRCSGPAAKLAVFDVPPEWDECWKLAEYDGGEWVIFDGERWLEKHLEMVRDTIPQARSVIETILQGYQKLRGPEDRCDV